MGMSESGNAVTVREARPEEIAAASHVVAEAFQSEGFTNHLFKLESPRAQVLLAHEFALMLRLKWDAGNTYLVAEQDGAIAGASLVSVPGQRPRTGWWRRFGAGIPRAIGILKLLRWIRWRNVLPTLKAMRPPAGMAKPHAVLLMLAVKPEHQGKGIARLLLDASHRLSDQEPNVAGVYLYTGDLRNRQIYARFGYELTAENCGREPFVTYHMFRPRGAAEPSAG